MILIPIGAEDGESRATPFVTIALVVANLLWFLLANVLPGSSWKEAAETARADLESYWLEHPDLTPPESLTRLLEPDELRDLMADVKAKAAGRRPEMSWLDDVNRQELDRRARRLSEALASRPAERYGFVSARPRVVAAFTSLFTHAGLVHLGGNMLFLWALGPFLEAALGPAVYAVLYVAGGLAALLTQWLAIGASNVPLVGASGAIATVMGGLLVRNAFAPIRFLFLPFLWAPRFRLTFGVPALVVLPLWFLEQVTSAHLDPDAPVGWWAHIGGFVFGLLVAGALRLRSPARASTGARRAAPLPRHGATPPSPARQAAPRSGMPAAVSMPRTASSPRLAAPGRASIRVAVVSTGASGEVVVTRGLEPMLRRALSRAAAGALALDEVVHVKDGPLDLRVELRVPGTPPRVASVLGVLKAGDARVLRVESRPSGLAAELS